MFFDMILYIFDTLNSKEIIDYKLEYNYRL